MSHAEFFINTWLKFFFILTPFFALSTFITMTRDLRVREKRLLALRVTGSVVIVCLILYFFGDIIFRVFGITIDSFRIGGGCLIMLAAIELVRRPIGSLSSDSGDIAVVPLAIPVIVGPGTTAAILVMGAEVQDPTDRSLGCIALALAGVAIGVLLLTTSIAERVAGERGLNILSKLTGLIMSAIASQMIFTGIKNFLQLGG
ncbi:MAG: hypothetical protein A2X49_16195 [Lentisphaerae bacterium GWF2_52_8]|nr:MAG: hypothetical protein A2X49_16195 [Lentisphaerae bacterium GWF2_52_8]